MKWYRLYLRIHRQQDFNDQAMKYSMKGNQVTLSANADLKYLYLTFLVQILGTLYSIQCIYLYLVALYQIHDQIVDRKI